jgi:hypothetical protein
MPVLWGTKMVWSPDVLSQNCEVHSASFEQLWPVALPEKMPPQLGGTALASAADHALHDMARISEKQRSA